MQVYCGAGKNHPSYIVPDDYKGGCPSCAMEAHQRSIELAQLKVVIKDAVVEAMHETKARGIVKALMPTISAVREAQWQPIESAPKDGTQILISGVMPWPVVAAWNGHHSAWGYASQQCELVDGEWNDYYWETDSIHPENNDLKWTSLPQPPQKEK